MKPTLFAHVPKTAGSSFVREVVEAHGIENAVNWDQSTSLNGSDAKLISSHVPYHLMEPLRTMGKGRFTFTILRDPVERVWSFARYKTDMVGNNHHPPEEFLFDAGKNDHVITGVSSSRQMWNRYCTQLGGTPYGRRPGSGDFYNIKNYNRPPFEQWMEQALATLEKFDAIYWVDDLGWQEKLWADVGLDWDGEVFHNVSETQDEMTPNQQQQAMYLTQYDRMFYNEAERIYR